MARYGFAFFGSGVRYGVPEHIPTTTMITLNRFLINPFDDPGISLAELLAFSTDHLQRLIANNTGGEFTVRITPTTSALTQVQNCAIDDQTKIGIRKARKQAKDSFREVLPANVAKIMGAVVAHYGPDAPEIAECCPEGRTVFSSCRDDQVAQHLQTLVNGVTAHQVDLGAALVTQATALKTGWTAIYNASETSTGQQTISQEGKKAARENLQLMLFLNLVFIAAMFPRQPEKLGLYMQQSLLENDTPSEPEPPPAPPTP